MKVEYVVDYISKCMKLLTLLLIGYLTVNSLLILILTCCLVISIVVDVVYILLSSYLQGKYAIIERPTIISKSAWSFVNKDLKQHSSIYIYERMPEILSIVLCFTYLSTNLCWR